MKVKMDAKELYEVLDAAAGYRDEALLNFMDGGILTRVREYSDTSIYSCLIPKDVMEEYEQGEYDGLGVDIERLKDFVPKKETPVTLELVNHKLHISHGNREYTMSLINPEDVNGVPDQVPDIDLGIKVFGETDWLIDFANESYSKIFNNEHSGMYIAVKGGMLYLWSNYDDTEMSEAHHLEDFDDFKADWQNCANKDKVKEGGRELNYLPKDDQELHLIVSTQFLKPISKIDGDSRVEFDNHSPLKVVTETESGIKHSWMIPPRLPSTNTRATVPDSIIKDRSLT